MAAVVEALVEDSREKEDAAVDGRNHGRTLRQRARSVRIGRRTFVAE